MFTANIKVQVIVQVQLIKSSTVQLNVYEFNTAIDSKFSTNIPYIHGLLSKLLTLLIILVSDHFWLKSKGFQFDTHLKSMLIRLTYLTSVQMIMKLQTINISLASFHLPDLNLIYLDPYSNVFGEQDLIVTLLATLLFVISIFTILLLIGKFLMKKRIL